MFQVKTNRESSTSAKYVPAAYDKNPNSRQSETLLNQNTCKMSTRAPDISGDLKKHVMQKPSNEHEVQSYWDGIFQKKLKSKKNSLEEQKG